MNEALKPRFAVDLDEIERQLSQAQPASAQVAPVTRNDPLAELARIVGQDDPFHSLLGEKSRQRPQDPAGLDDLFEVRPEPREPERQSYELRASGGNAAPAAQPAYAEPAVAYEDYQAPETHGPDSFDSRYDQVYGQPEAAQSESLVYAPHDEHGHRAAKAGARKGMLALGAVAGAVLLGLGGAFVYNGGGSALMSGEPPLITAKNEPTKIQPQTPGGVEIPNQNKQIYERAANETPTKIVNREEQPVDVRQATRVPNANAEFTGTTDSPGKAQQNGGLNLGEPRRVRTVSIRPDGGVVGSDSAASRPAAVPGAAMAMAQTAQPAPISAASNPAMPVRQAAASPVSTPSSPTTQPRPAATTPAAAAPKATPAPVATGGPSPQPSSTPATQPAPQRVASAQPVTIAPSTAPAAADPGATGAFSVQLGVSPSEAEARTTFQKLQQKYADLSGRGSMIRKADVNGGHGLPRPRRTHVAG